LKNIVIGTFIKILLVNERIKSIEEKIAPERILKDMSSNIKDDILTFVKNQILNIKKQTQSNIILLTLSINK